jgi:hypothetical protein
MTAIIHRRSTIALRRTQRHQLASRKPTLDFKFSFESSFKPARD